MNPIRIARGPLLGAALMAGCTERNAPTDLTATPAKSISADATAANTSVVSDLQGDAAKGTPDYQDIVKVQITKQGTKFVLVMTLVAPVPNNPPVPSWADLIVWEFYLDTDPNAFPLGYPFTKNSAGFFEFQIQHRVYRSGYSDPYDPTSSPGILVDRRPLLSDEQVKIIPIQFTIEGATLTWVVDAALLGDPSTFNWASGAAAAQAGNGDVKNGYNNISGFDFAPDLNLVAPLALWPQ